MGHIMTKAEELELWGTKQREATARQEAHERRIEDTGRSHAAEAWDQRHAYDDAYMSYSINLSDTGVEQGWKEWEHDLASTAFDQEWDRLQNEEGK